MPHNANFVSRTVIISLKTTNLTNVSNFIISPPDIDSFALVSNRLTAFTCPLTFQISSPKIIVTKTLNTKLIYAMDFNESQVLEFKLGGFGEQAVYILIQKSEGFGETAHLSDLMRMVIAESFGKLSQQSKSVKICGRPTGHAPFKLTVHKEDWTDFALALDVKLQNLNIGDIFYYRASHGLKSRPADARLLIRSLVADPDSIVLTQIHVGFHFHESNKHLGFKFERLSEAGVKGDLYKYPRNLRKDVGNFSHGRQFLGLEDVSYVQGYDERYHALPSKHGPLWFLMDLFSNFGNDPKNEHFKSVKEQILQSKKLVTDYFQAPENGARVELVVSKHHYISDILDIVTTTYEYAKDKMAIAVTPFSDEDMSRVRQIVSTDRKNVVSLEDCSESSTYAELREVQKQRYWAQKYASIKKSYFLDLQIRLALDGTGRTSDIPSLRRIQDITNSESISISENTLNSISFKSYEQFNRDVLIILNSLKFPASNPSLRFFLMVGTYLTNFSFIHRELLGEKSPASLFREDVFERVKANGSRIVGHATYAEVAKFILNNEDNFLQLSLLAVEEEICQEDLIPFLTNFIQCVPKWLLGEKEHRARDWVKLVTPAQYVEIFERGETMATFKSETLRNLPNLHQYRNRMFRFQQELKNALSKRYPVHFHTYFIS